MTTAEEDRMPGEADFVTTGPAEVAVVIVTYNSAPDLGRLLRSLRAEAADQRMRVLIADNGSTDGTVAAARTNPDVLVLETGGNLGYAGAINVARRWVEDTESLLVLNPDLDVLPGCVAALRERLRTSGAGIVVPRILDADDVLSASLRTEPTLLRALGDAAFGGRARSRPAALSETVFAPHAYLNPHRIDWATGAALLIHPETAAAVGDWDERFFLYSEETDFFRRARDAGYEAWYEPTAVVRHGQGGSGSSLALEQLLAVNRVRYARKHHGRAGAALFRLVVVAHALVRCTQPRYRSVLRTVLSERSWAALPHASHVTTVAGQEREVLR